MVAAGRRSADRRLVSAGPLLDQVPSSCSPGALKKTCRCGPEVRACSPPAHTTRPSYQLDRSKERGALRCG
jgi:hypothetical protein